jgi:isoleucyl-tRNA synthetase
MAGKSGQNFLEGEFNLPKLEEKVLKFWDEHKIFEKSLAKKGKPFVFYEGPPYANGRPGIHHVLARVVKDVILRYKTMRGYPVPRRGGWDTHGLPVEIAAEKALGLKSKRDIEKYGVHEFNEKAKEQVWLYKDEWERLTRRIGYWLDLKNAYVTYAPEYIETIWWTLAQLWKRKLLYKGHKVVPWCTRCGTALSSHELALGYQEVTDQAAYVKFKLKPGQKIGNWTTSDRSYVLSWTTTPWTLPGNVALAVGKNVEYVRFKNEGSNFREISGEKGRVNSELIVSPGTYILAKDIFWKNINANTGQGGLSGIAHFLDISSETLIKDLVQYATRPNEFLKKHKIEIVTGNDLVGLSYEPLFDVKTLRSENSYKIYPADFVTTTEGTGVVHTAVMYGEDDYQLGKKVGLPEHHTVDEEGKFTKDVPGLAGDYVKAKDTEEDIFRHLEKRGYLLKREPYTHEYPFCWRCGTPLLYYARTSWFIAMSKLRAELLKRNKTIHWLPAHIKEGRFGEWLREVKDWNLSRERYWGAPLPIWECGGCAHTEVVGCLDELDRLASAEPKNHYWAMRHGESEGNAFNIIDSGNQRFHLTALGRAQIERSARDLAREKVDLIFSSDLPRAKESAEIAAKILGVEKVVHDARLREINLASLSGKSSSEYWKLLPSQEEKFVKRAVSGAESLREVRARVLDFLMDVERQHKGKHILLVSHEDTIWMAMQTALGWSDRRAAAMKTKDESDFIMPGEVIRFQIKAIPRDETGEVDLHRPFVDSIVFPCPKCGKDMKRVPGVTDVWYDSGAMPYAQVHFPFELPKRIAYPADYIAEGIDQTRGWFYTLLAIATALGYEAPYKNVITFGLVNDKSGQKMSKSKGNIVEPFAVIDKYGVDAVRWYFFTGTPFGESRNFDEGDVAKSFRKMHLIVYNSFVFWKTYASITHGPLKSSKNILDKWILARLNALIESVTKKLDRYEIREAALEMEAFVDDLSRWYIRRSRRRLQRPEDPKDYQAASAALGYVLLSLTKLMAPFMPFFAEILYAGLRGSEESVHMDAWPKADKHVSPKRLIDAMAMVREFAALGLAKRAEAGVKVRQPLASMSVGAKLGKDLEKILGDEVNVKKILVDAKLKNQIKLDVKITPALREEGLVREIARTLQELRQRAGLHPKDEVLLFLDLPTEVKNAVMNSERALLADVGAKSVEYRRSDKFDVEEVTKLEEQEVWIGLRKI